MAKDEFYIDAKSIQRMRDIVTKASAKYGHVDEWKQNQLCETMAGLITDPKKALDRYEAATYVFGMNTKPANIFLSRAVGLGNPDAISIRNDRNAIREGEAAKAREEERNRKFNQILQTYDLFNM